jgi:2-polyprenyl-3-methyl-5-hydroxy-6-metoxy-1,4-benzoquinol methylase
MTAYNKHYQQENYFGKTYPELIRYFEPLKRTLSVLDLGCGQGRDVLTFGRMGFKVTGIDLSSVGIEQLNTIAQKEDLDVIGAVGDLKSVDNIGEYDIVLMNSMFHFYKSDIEDETKTLNDILNQIKVGGRLITIVQESKKRVRYLKEVIEQSEITYEIEHEESFIYKEFNGRFYMVASKRVK